MKLSVIITAGGIGKRFSSTIPKQFLNLDELPILMHTIQRFSNWKPEVKIILTLPKEWREYWDGLIEKHDFNIPHQIVDGGRERFHSIKNALNVCSDGHVMIHDGVRPLVSTDTLSRSHEALKTYDAVVPYLEIKDSIRVINNGNSEAVDRKKYVTVQTPQCFNLDVVKKAYLDEYQVAFTDDASVVENSGVNIHLIDGNEENIKITTQKDLLTAMAILKNIK
ncbi:MAG: 2-C-methyl-D-erythritol 4-phosphate cytidylyltransferase [Crocinitomicaceae bacterium]|nr:2-C-methyl-D-erythritol 4-phosphate cytidylyltransferase [Crocinitomicaceae bacterium]